MNHLVLNACIIEREAVRYTPVGVPIVNCLLFHRSQVDEAGVTRQIEMKVPAMAIGELSGLIAQCALDQIFCFTGFLAPHSRHTRALRFHLTALQTV
jgi:primosomal replication protein N